MSDKKKWMENSVALFLPKVSPCGERKREREILGSNGRALSRPRSSPSRRLESALPFHEKSVNFRKFPTIRTFVEKKMKRSRERERLAEKKNK